jgi:hypothetical protein
MAFEIRPLTAAYADRAFDLATQTFVNGSSLHKARGILLTEYRDHLGKSFGSMIDEGLSVMAVDPQTDMLGGCMIVTDYHNRLDKTGPTHPRFAAHGAMTTELIRQYAAHQPIEPGLIILVDMAAVPPSNAGAGLYQSMRAAVHDIAKQNGFRRVVGELSSTTTQHVVLTRLGHKKRAEVTFAAFEFDGEYPYQSIQNPPSYILAEGEL